MNGSQISNSSGTAAMAQETVLPRATRRRLFVGYIVLLLGLLALDQSTKFHAQQSFLQDSHPTIMLNYLPTEARVFHLGVTPFDAREHLVEHLEATPNWLDFSLTYLRNPGAVWGLFSNLPEGVRPFVFYTITLIAIVVLWRLFRLSHESQKLYRTALVFIFAGAAGNFVDRVLLQYVIDLYHFQWRIFGWEYSFPVFNSADVYINLGVGLILLDLLRNEIGLRSSSSSAAEPQKSASA